MAELGASVDVIGVARHYQGLIDKLIIDEADAAEAPRIEALGIAVETAPAIMRSQADRIALATATLAAAGVAVEP
jgi:LPPG:FO 2-phospho-L-lactate transferase